MFDKIFLPLRVWFNIGYAEISLILSVVSFSMQIVTVATLKGWFDVTMPIMITLGGFVILVCVVLGFIYDKMRVQYRINERSTQKINPIVNNTHENTKEILEILRNKKNE